MECNICQALNLILNSGDGISSRIKFMMNGVSRTDTRSRSRRQASSLEQQAASVEGKTMTKKSALAVNAIVDLTAMNTEVFINYKSFERQATSCKPRATSVKRLKTQATSSKPQAPSNKRQATSHEQQAPRFYSLHKDTRG